MVREVAAGPLEQHVWPAVSFVDDMQADDPTHHRCKCGCCDAEPAVPGFVPVG